MTRYLLYAYMSSVPITRDVLSGASSLGGSESACLGLLEALAARGHDCHVFADRLDEDAAGDWRGVTWHAAETLPATLQFQPPDVFVSLRMPAVFLTRIDAGLTILWAQDLLTDPSHAAAVSQVDRIAYVSQYHRAQWESVQPVVAPLGWVTRNGIRLADVPEAWMVARMPHRFLYTSRPERGLLPLLQMWPRIRRRIPGAELRICRYRSMYDGEGTAVAQTCRDFDALTADVQRQAGGIVILGHLNKPDLYRELSAATALLYPGVAGFAETNGIAWTEAQACGTPILSSWKGAAPETIHPDAGILFDGDAESAAYQTAYIEAVCRLDADPARQRAMGEAGRAWAARCDHAVIAEEWEQQITEAFERRFASNREGVLRQLLWQDQHVAAHMLASSMLLDGPHEEADAAQAMCAEVIEGRGHSAEEYATFTVQSGVVEARQNERLKACADLIASERPQTVLDVACGNGSMAVALAERLPEAVVTGVDFSAGVLDLARAAALESGHAGRLTFQQAPWTDLSGVYDAVFCGEFLEHVAEPWALLDRLEQHCHPDGQIVLTCPAGPYIEILARGIPRHRSHVHTFSARDLGVMLQDKRDVSITYLPSGLSPRGSAIGVWQIRYRPGGGPARHLDYAHLILTTRPYQRVTATLIVKDEADWLRRCLTSIWPVVDRIVVVDTGSTDGSQAICRAFDATVIEVPWPADFSVARNLALEEAERGGCEWVLWIDADETLDRGDALRMHLTGAGPYQGYAIRQTHLQADQPVFSDHPVRVFRANRGVRFYGVVHEQPEDAQDQGITPALGLTDVQVLHYGYVTDPVRRQKMLDRNLDLLRRELAGPSPRVLAYALAMRDSVTLARFARESAGGALTPDARRSLLRAVALYQQHFADPAHRLHALARPFYEDALRELEQGWEAEWGVAAVPGSRRPQAKASRARVADLDDLRREMDAAWTAWRTAVEGPSLTMGPVVSRGAGQWEATC